jgi:hypothetical protein
VSEAQEAADFPPAANPAQIHDAIPAADRAPTPDAILDAVLAKNLAALGSRFPALVDLLLERRKSGGVARFGLSIHPTASGELSAKLDGGLWLHSPRAPREEARRLASAGLEPASDAALLLGFGLGYLAEACLDADIEQVLVCEADPDLLLAALGSRDLSRLLADPRLGFVVGGEADAVLSALEVTGASRASILGLKAAELAFPDWYAEARAAAERWNAKGQANENTLRRFGRLWVRNLAKNLDQASRAPGVREIEGRFAGMSAIVLAAGPSLDGVLPFMHEIARRAIVICVDTALRSLLIRGPEPDFLVVVDPQYWNWRHIADLASPRSILVSESAAWPAVFRSPCRRVFLGGSLFPLGRRIEGFFGAKGDLGAGGSVATSAWDLARLLGCEPIWMAGMDLGFPRGATHARASLFEQRSLASGTRLKTAESEQTAAVYCVHGAEAPAAGGGRVRTDARMRLYAWWFEARRARPGAPRTVSRAPEGLAIPGMELGSMEELLAAPILRADIDRRMDEIASRNVANGPAPEERGERGREGLARLLAELEDIAAEAETAVAAAREAALALAEGEAGAERLEPALERLNEADRAIADCAAKEVIAFLMPPLGDLLSRRARNLGESIEQSEAVYRSVAKSARYHLEALSNQCL